jgi:hypothetical protein
LFLQKLKLVYCLISSVLRDPWEKVSQNDNLFIQLEQAIAVFLKDVRYTLNISELKQVTLLTTRTA